MDPISEWLEGQDELHGMGVKAACTKARSDLGLSDRELSQALFGRRVKASKRWSNGQLSGGVRVILGRGRTDIPSAPRPISFFVDDLVD